MYKGKERNIKGIEVIRQLPTVTRIPRWFNLAFSQQRESHEIPSGMKFKEKSKKSKLCK